MINMDCKITLSVNAGVSIQIEGKKILVDAFFEAADEGISVMTQELFHRVMEAPEFQNANCLFFTHAHKDHYSAGMTKAYLENYPECLLIGPETVSPDETIRNPRVVLSEDVSMKIHGIDFDFFSLLHEGGPSKETPHFGCMISVGGKTILMPGDGKLFTEELAAKVKGREINLAILDFPWLTAPGGIDYVYGKINPSNVILYHLPAPEDDKFRYLAAVDYALAKLPEEKNAQILCRPLQTIEVHL